MPAPTESSGYSIKDGLVANSISSESTVSIFGISWPPHSISAPRPIQPPSAYCLNASLKPAGVVTLPFSIFAPSSSPVRFSGSVTFCENFAISSRIASAVAASRCARFSLACQNCSALKTSFRMNFISASGAL